MSVCVSTRVCPLLWPHKMYLYFLTHTHTHTLLPPCPYYIYTPTPYRYGGSKLERARDLFETALQDVPADKAKVLYLEYAALEEQHGLARHAMEVSEVCHTKCLSGVCTHNTHSSSVVSSTAWLWLGSGGLSVCCI